MRLCINEGCINVLTRHSLNDTCLSCRKKAVMGEGVEPKIPKYNRRPSRPPCAAEGCDKLSRPNGYCGTHSYRLKKYGSLERPKKAKPFSSKPTSYRVTDQMLIDYCATLRDEKANGVVKFFNDKGCITHKQRYLLLTMVAYDSIQIQEKVNQFFEPEVIERDEPEYEQEYLAHVPVTKLTGSSAPF